MVDSCRILQGGDGYILDVGWSLRRKFIPRFWPWGIAGIAGASFLPDLI